ncbi:MAG: hypothetical protein KBD28_03595 [Chitinophagaceae bacterium]|nr:hypothetical protein [Chitinophagaceae bacterium]
MIVSKLALSQDSLNNSYPKVIILEDSTKLIAITPAQMDSIAVRLIKAKELPICDSVVNAQKKEIVAKDTFIANQALFIDFYKKRDDINGGIRRNQDIVINELKSSLKKEKQKAVVIKIANFVCYPIAIIGTAIATYYISSKLK